jgi:hypothetical protein
METTIQSFQNNLSLLWKSTRFAKYFMDIYSYLLVIWVGCFWWMNNLLNSLSFLLTTTFSWYLWIWRFHSSSEVEFTKGLPRSWDVQNIWARTPFTIDARYVIHTMLTQCCLAPTLGLVQIAWKYQSLSRRKETLL